jgi:hypothetical protein
VAGYADPIQLWELAGSLADVAGCPVDLLDLRASSPWSQQLLDAGARLIQGPSSPSLSLAQLTVVLLQYN